MAAAVVPVPSLAKCTKDLERLCVPRIVETAFVSDGKLRKIEALVQIVKAHYPGAWTLAQRESLWFDCVTNICKEKPIAASSDAEAKFVYSCGFNHIRKNSTTTHSLARCARAVADRVQLLTALKRCQDATIREINDYFGAARGLDLWYAVSNLADQSFGKIVGYTWYRPLLTPKDALDYSALLRTYPSSIPAVPFVALLTDIYLTPKAVCSLLAATTADSAVMSSQLFMRDTLVGAHFDKMIYYNDEGVVRQSPSPLDHEWQATNINQDWLTERACSVSGQHFVWDKYRQVSDYHVFKILKVPVSMSVPTTPIPEDPSSMIVRKVLRPISWKAWWTHLKSKISFSETIFNRDLFVFQPAVRTLSGFMAYKTRQTYQLSALHKEVSDVVSAHLYVWEGLPANTPYTVQRVVSDTMMWLFWSNFQEESRDMQGVAADLGQEWALYKSMKNSLNNVPDIKYLQAALLLFGVGIILTRQLARQGTFRSSILGMSVMATLKRLSRKSISSFYTWLYNPDNWARVQKFTRWATVIGDMFAPVYEEWFKKKAGLTGTVAIAAFEAHAFGAFSTPLFIFKLALHEVMRRSPDPVLVHTLWNSWVHYLDPKFMDYPQILRALPIALATGPASPQTAMTFVSNAVFTLAQICRRPPPASVAGNILRRFKEDYANIRSHTEDYEKTIPVSIEEAYLPAITRAPIYENCPFPEDLVRDPKVHTGVYILLGTTRMFYRPQGPLQFWNALEQRNRNPAPCTPTCEAPGRECRLLDSPTGCPLGVQWNRASRVFTSALKEVVLDVKPVTSQEWIAHFGTALKKHRARDGIEQRNEGMIRKKTGIFLKGDEVLYGRPEGLKGRTVKTLDPTIQALCYKHIDHAMDMVKMIFNERQPFSVRDWKVTMTVGSGKVSSELDAWLSYSMEWVSLSKKRVAAIMAGDDFFALVHDQRLQVYENDFKSFDRTQGVHAHQAEWKALLRLGVPDYVCHVLFTTVGQTPVYQNERFDMKYKVKMPYQRATGAPDTTLGNTIINMHSLLYALEVSNSMTTLATDQARLGLIAKLTTHDSVNSATFLKGWWVPTIQGTMVWLPLPSQVIKLGKILTNPRDIFKHLGADLAWRSAASSMAASYGTVPFDYPLFGSLLKRYSYLGGEVKELDFQKHKVKVDTQAVVDVEAVTEMICGRYGISEDEIYDMEIEIASAPFPGLLVHPAWRFIAERDYG